MSVHTFTVTAVLKLDVDVPDGTTQEEAGARASVPGIIVAGPDLLAACRRAAEEGQHAAVCPWWKTPAGDLVDPALRRAAEQCCDCYLGATRAAVAKAEGGAS